jgi:hypothetical protein
MLCFGGPAMSGRARLQAADKIVIDVSDQPTSHGHIPMMTI